MSQKVVSRPTDFILNLVIGIYSFLCVFPILLILAISLTDEKSLLTQGYHLIPKELSLTAYEYILKDAGGILRAYGVTIIVTIIGTILSVIITAAFAYPLSRSNLKYANKLSFFIYFTMLFNGGLVPTYFVCTQLLHLKNTIFAMILPMLINAFNVLILRTFFKTSVPESIIESANIDGAGEIKIFFSIVLKISLPGIATIALFSTIGYWNDFYLCLLYITKPEFYNLQFLLYKLQTNMQFLLQLSQSNNSYASTAVADLPAESSRMAVAILAIGPIILTYPFFQKYFIKGLTVGAVKG